MDLAKKRDELILQLCVFLATGWLGSADAQPVHTAWPSCSRFGFTSRLSPSKKGAKETGFNFKDFSALTELADKPENKGSGDTAGLGVTALCCPHSV